MTISKYKKTRKSRALVRAPKGYYFKIEDYGNNNFYVRLYDRKNKVGTGPIGHIHLTNAYGAHKKYLMTHSSLNRDYHGKGLGAYMYARAIQFALDNGYKVRSSGGSSEMAQRVWRGHYIRKWFRITARKTNGPYCDTTWYATHK